MFPVDGGITAAKGAIGKLAKGQAEKPSGELSLDHTLDGATDMSRGAEAPGPAL